MNTDELQQVWRSQMTGRKLTIDAEVLLQQLERNRTHFERMVFWRDVREVVVAIVMVPIWVWLGLKDALPWTWYLCIPALLWIAGFMAVDRVRQRRRQPVPGDPLRACAESSLAQVQHQIWLLRNVVWWYLLPPGVALGVFFAHCAWIARDTLWLAELIMAGVVGVAALIFWGVYRLNRATVRNDLEPRRRELQALIANLNGTDHSESPNSGASTAPPPASPAKRRVGAWLVLIGLVLVLILGAAVRYGEKRLQPVESGLCPAAGDAAVTNLLVSIRQKHNVPAIAAAIVTSKGLEAVGVAGVRKRGTEVPTTLDDLWHLGSDTKAMTATLVARLVEQTKLRWDTTLAEVFPDLAGKFHPDMRRVTLLQLLSHRSGLRPNLNLNRFRGEDVRSERLRAVREELAKPPQHPPGSYYEYSNLGYVIAGAVVERVTGKTWEEAIREQVFVPLKMTSAGFGGTGTPGQINQPWPHGADGKPMPENGPAMDNPPVMGPAGRVHCTIQDWAKFIQDQLRGARGEPALLSPESYRKLHTPPFGGEYALGWIVVEREWGGGTVFNHGGDNTMNCANVWIAPQRDFAILVCVNQSGDKSFEASDEAVGALIKLHTSTASASPSR